MKKILKAVLSVLMLVLVLSMVPAPTYAATLGDIVNSIYPSDKSCTWYLFRGEKSLAADAYDALICSYLRLLAYFGGVNLESGDNTMAPSGVLSFFDPLSSQGAGQGSPFGSLIKAIVNALIPMAILVTVVFFLIELAAFLNTIEHGDPIRKSGLLLLKYLFIVILVSRAQDVMAGFYYITVLISNAVSNALTTAEASKALSDTVTAVASGAANIQSFGNIGLLLGLIVWLICFLAVLFIIIVKYQFLYVFGMRYLQILFYIAFSPIPLSTFSSHHLQEYGKSYLRNFFALGMQVAVLQMIPILWITMMGNIASSGLLASSKDAITLLVLYVSSVYILSAAIRSSAEWTRNLLGGH